MATRTKSVAVGHLSPADLLFTDADAPHPGTTSTVVVQNVSGGDVFLGGSDVTTANGIRVAAGASFSLDLTFGDGLFAIQADTLATKEVRVLHTGL